MIVSEVMEKSLVSCFFLTHGVEVYSKPAAHLLDGWMYKKTDSWYPSFVYNHKWNN